MDSNNDPAKDPDGWCAADTHSTCPSGGSRSIDEAMALKANAGKSGGKCDTYNLRKTSLRVRVLTEEKKQQPKPRQSKSRPPPLSKYRRRTANARERSRMAEINDAFEDLKHALPQAELQDTEHTSDRGISSSKNGSSSSSSRTKNQPTKVTVLRLAIDYIAALRDILGHDTDSTTDTSSGSSCDSSCGSSTHGLGDNVNDELGSDAASSSAPSTSSNSGDEESLMSSDVDSGGLTSDMDSGGVRPGMEGMGLDLDLFDPSLTADFSPDLSPDFTATLSPEEEVCLELVTSVL